MSPDPYALTPAQVFERLREALAAVATQHRTLLVQQIAERTVARHVANELEALFDGWDVDTEYNGLGPGLLRKKMLFDGRDHPIFPDIIVHERALPNNLLYVEIKARKAKGREHDRKKLRAALADDRLRYRFAAFVTYQTGPDARFFDPEFDEEPGMHFQPDGTWRD